jgi:multidrug efflux system outer membrane protein
MSRVRGIVVLLAGGLAACTLAPRYERPEAPVPEAFEGVAATSDETPAADIAWSEFFPDAELRDLIRRALANNRDLRVATLNVEAARAQYRIQRADLVPAIDATGTADNERVPPSLSPTGEGEVTRTYSAGLATTAFELDLFGRVRSLRKAALERYFALEARAR